METSDQLEFLRIKGCDYYQGYLRARQLPANEFELQAFADCPRKAVPITENTEPEPVSTADISTD